VVKAMLPDGDLWFSGNDTAHKRRENANLEHPGRNLEHPGQHI
jgi:hypothetical protein